MDGDRKKRKIDAEPAGGEEEEESEEQKMEKFFALIRSTREVHDRLRGGGPLASEESEKSREDQRKAEEDRPGRRESVWNPTFRPEDFSLDPIQYKPSATPSAPDVPRSTGRKARAGPSQSKQDDEGKDDDDKEKTGKDDDDKEKTGKDDNDGDGDGDGKGGLNLKLSL